MSVTIDDLAGTLGALRRAELRWFEVLGSWMRTEADPRVITAFAGSCQRRALHASLLGHRLPTYDTGAGAGGRRVSPDAVTVDGPLTDELLRPADTGTDTTRRLSAFYRVALPRLLVEYGVLLAATDGRTDGPTHRVLSLVTADDTAELAGVDDLLRRTGVSDG